MKIGIVTFHCSYNYGSVIQAYALQQFLQSLGHDVRILDFYSKDFRQQYQLLRYWKARSLVADMVLLPGNIKRKRAFVSFQHRYLHLTKQRYLQGRDEKALARDVAGYDAFVCGSDQIWNLDCTGGIVPEFFLSFASSAVRKIAYAPSLGHTSFQASHFTPEIKKQLSAYLDDFDAISVREESTIPLFQALTKNRISSVVDPTLLVEPEHYRSIEAGRIPNRPYIFLYCLEINDALFTYCNKLARNEGLAIAYISKLPKRFGVPSYNYYGTSPDNFLKLIDNAACVVTNSFHATVFSILFEKRFTTFATKSSSSRMTDLLSELGLTDHLASSQYEAPKAQNGADVFARLSKMTEGSKQFLIQALDTSRKER